MRSGEPLDKNTWLKSLIDHHSNIYTYSPKDVGSNYGIYSSEVVKGNRDREVVLIRKGKEYYSYGGEGEEGSLEDSVKGCEGLEFDIEEATARKFLRLKASARKRGKEFNLTLSDVKLLMKRKTCYYTGVKLDTSNIVTDNQLTIDRKDPSLGYIKGNVVSCSHLANQFKAKIEHDFHEVLTREKQLAMLTKMFS